LLQYPQYAEVVGRTIAEPFRSLEPEVVLGPAMGGILLSQAVARYLGVRGIFAERGEDRRMTLRRGFALNPRERVLLCDDVVESGRSLNEVLEIVKDWGAVTVGIGVIVDRRRIGVAFDIPFHALERLEAKIYAPQECPLCVEGVPLVAPGSRFLSGTDQKADL